MKLVYLIPAPDLDTRVVESLQIEGVNFVPLNLPMLNFSSDLKDVINHLAMQVDCERPVILGFCYGGVLAVELAKKIDAPKIIIVSSVRNNQEIVTSRKILGFCFYMTPEFILRGIGLGISFLITSILRSDVKIPRIWLKAAQNKFIIKHMLSFNDRGVKGEIIRIHGNSDKLFPLANAKAEYVINDSGHFMFVHRRKEFIQALDQAIR